MLHVKLESDSSQQQLADWDVDEQDAQLNVYDNLQPKAESSTRTSSPSSQAATDQNPFRLPLQLGHNISYDEDCWEQYYDCYLTDKIHQFSAFLDDDSKPQQGYHPKAYGFRSHDYIAKGLENREFRIISYLQSDTRGYKRWRQTVHVACFHELDMIGVGFARAINRIQMPALFRSQIDPLQRDALHQVVEALFDDHCHLKAEFTHDPRHTGTGAWGNELNDGILFIIDHVMVREMECCRNGLGRAMVESLLNRLSSIGEKWKPRYTLVIPRWLTSEMKKTLFGKSKLEQNKQRLSVQRDIERFWRSLGFRRIGASAVFGLAADPQHKSHATEANDDFNPETRGIEAIRDTENQLDTMTPDPLRSVTIKLLKLKLLREKFPLHYSTVILSDTACLEFYQLAIPLEEWDRGNWIKGDPSRNNILHIAAVQGKAKSVRELMKLSRLNNWSLDTQLNNAGYTPIQELKSTLVSERNTTPNFQGFPDEAAACLSALRGEAGPTETAFLRDKYGCTCDSCTAGFISRSMTKLILDETVECFTILCSQSYRTKSADEDYLLHCGIIAHVPRGIRGQLITDTFLREGFGQVFCAIRHVLLNGQAPTLQNVASYQFPDPWRRRRAEEFYSRGGTVESALRYLFEAIREHLHSHITPPPQVHEAYIVGCGGLGGPNPCRNDNEVEYVAMLCGVPDL